MAKDPRFEVKAIRREFDPANECIYCHRKPPEVELTEEHIIPEGLGARWVYPAASCRDCARQTHAFEGHVIGRMFGDTRRHFGIRGKKRKRPLHPTVLVDRGGGTQEEMVPLETHPAVLFMPLFGPPGILLGWQRSEAFAGRIQMINFVPDLNAHLQALGGKVNLTRGFGMEPFGRMLCKIAHAFAMASAKGEFDPNLEGIILGRRPFHLSHYVGTSIVEERRATAQMRCTSLVWPFSPTPTTPLDLRFRLRIWSCRFDNSRL